MSGTRGGVQKIIKETYTDAQYIHCYAHKLNLVMAKAASVNRAVRIFFSNVQGICAFFSNSPQRTQILDDIVKKRLPRPVATRWTYHSRTVNIFYNHREDLIKTMEHMTSYDEILNNETIDQATGHLKKLKSQSFIFWLSFFQKIMPLSEILFAQFQKISLDSSSIHETVTNFERNVSKVRNSIDVGVEEGPSYKKRKQEDDRSEWKRQAVEVCDVITTQVKDRFEFSGHLVAASLFTPSKFSEYEKKIPVETLKAACEQL
ncbi:hypothetical protein WDU94_010906 [Cyamophila willieti]